MIILHGKMFPINIQLKKNYTNAYRLLFISFTHLSKQPWLQYWYIKWSFPVPNNLKAFTLHDLKAATRNFRSDSMIGEGGFGRVYKGWIDETTLAPARPGTGQVVAVKVLKSESHQGHREWLVSHLF